MTKFGFLVYQKVTMPGQDRHMTNICFFSLKKVTMSCSLDRRFSELRAFQIGIHFVDVFIQ